MRCAAAPLELGQLPRTIDTNGGVEPEKNGSNPGRCRVARASGTHLAPARPDANLRQTGLLRVVVKRFALVDDVHGEQFQRSVTDDFEAVLDITEVERSRSGR